MVKGEERNNIRVRRGANQVVASVLLFVLITIAGSILIHYAYSKYAVTQVELEKRLAEASALESIRVMKVYEANNTTIYFARSVRPVTLAVNDTTYIIVCNPQCTSIIAPTMNVSGRIVYVVPVNGTALFRTSSSASIYVVASYYGEYDLVEVVGNG